MSLSFLPKDIKFSIDHLNYNFLTEIRLRRGQPAIVEYKGKYCRLGKLGLSVNPNDLLFVSDVAVVLNAATDGCVYGYTEQMKGGFITIGHGIRVGIAGEYVTSGDSVTTIKSITSLNIRIPHDVRGCAKSVCKIFSEFGLKNTLLYSRPGLGKTTMLRDIALTLSCDDGRNVLIFDERGEIAAMDGYGEGFDLGAVDVVRCFSKKAAIASAIRAMKPGVIITDELYGESDISAVRYAADCGIVIIASSHVTDKRILKEMPFDYYVELNSIGGQPRIYDKDFNTYSAGGVDDCGGGTAVGEQKEKNAGVFRTV